MGKIEITIPKGFMNCCVTTDNKFVADTNNSADWKTMQIPLPKPKHRWQVNNYSDNFTKVELVDLE